MGLPRIERVPSQDALERAIHNDSGHGKSTAQFIKELKASNSKLSAKTAEMEAEFMNQVNELTLKFNLKEEALQKTLSTKEQQISTMESRIASTETRIRERDSQVAKLKEETTFQRHSIADLKNQLYQLQHEIEDAEYDKVDGVDKWSTERAELERELESLRKEVKSLSETKDDRNAMACWKQLDTTKVELDATKKRLSETQAALATLERDSKTAEKSRVNSIELGSAKELEKQLAQKDNTIASMKEEINKYEAKVESMSAEIADARARLQNEDKYRRDEADDLRVLNDSLRADVENLKADLDEMEREIDEKNELLLEKDHEIGQLHAEIETVEKELFVCKERVPTSDRNLPQPETTSQELQSAQIEYKALEEKLVAASETFEEQISVYTEQISSYEKRISSLENNVQDLVKERDGLEKKLECAEKARAEALQDLEQGRKDFRTQDESRSEQRLREIVAKAAKERSDLEAEFGEKLKNVEMAYEQKMALLAVGNSEREELHFLRNETKRKAMEIESMKEQLQLLSRASENQVSSTEVQSLRNQIRLLEAKKASAERNKKQLREAQIALVALDDEKIRSDKAHRDKIKALENQMHDIQREFQTQILRKDAELTQLRDKSSLASECEAEIARLNAEIKEKDALLHASKSRSAVIGENGNLSDAVRKELLLAKKTEEKLRLSLAQAREELASHKATLREKVADRDTTISALVKSSVSQEQKMVSMKAEINALTAKLKKDPPSPTEMEATQRAREEEYIGEIENLRSALEDCKDVENRLLHSLSTLERDLAKAESECIRLRSSKSDSAYSKSMLSDHDEKLQERDSAIGNLVQQSMGLEQQVRNLMTENGSLRESIEGLLHGSKGNAPSWDEIRRLQNESEIFAGQIIEQDEELESLRSALEKRDARITLIERENAALKRKASSISQDNFRVDELQAELDELQEANNTQRAELRDMRKQLREAIGKANEAQDLRAELEQAKHALEQLNNKVGSSAREDANLRRQLEIAQLEKEEIEKKLNGQIDSMRRLRNSTIEGMEDKLRQKDAEIAELQSNEKVIMLETEIKKLSKQLFEKAEMLEDSQKSIAKLKATLDDKSTIDEMAKRDAEIQGLNKEVLELRKQLVELEADKMDIDSTKALLQNANAEKEELETKIVAAYERKISMLQYDKDVTIDSLRKELTEAKALNSEHNEDALKHIEMLERQNRDANEELQAKLQLKNMKIQALEQTLGAQEQLVENMRAEMDQLQSSMERTSLSRRAEIEEMQQEMIDISSKAQRQEREITSLKMALEEVQLERASEVNRLKEQLSSVEMLPSAYEEAATKPKPRDSRLEDVKERLENMKWRNTTLQEENVKLRKRLEKLENEFESTRPGHGGTSAAEDEVVALRRRVQELEQMTALEPPPPPPPALLESQRQSSRPPSGDINGSRFGRAKKPPSPVLAQQVQAAPPPEATAGKPSSILEAKTNERPCYTRNTQERDGRHLIDCVKNDFLSQGRARKFDEFEIWKLDVLYAVRPYITIE
ncbi:hypothetical protein MHU86_4400 [Fragilaria crotonensis]|nr:hypothetical protein MHU86_4400 [Fragilaria crotonensis]